MKLCVKCNTDLPDNLFRVVKQKGRKPRLGSWCVPCTKSYNKTYYSENREDFDTKKRDRYFQKKFGMTVEEVDNEISVRENKCDICGNESDHRFKRLNVDHCHKTNVVRGFLCFSCNVMIGQSKDDPEILRKAADYLEKDH